MKNMLRAVVLAGILMLVASFPSFASEWRQDWRGWWFENSDGSYPYAGIYEIGGEIYIFDYDGYLMTDQWVQSPVSGEWYYCQDGGEVARNQWVGDYYVGSEGKMLKNQWVGDYYVGSDGAWVPSATKNTGSNSGSAKSGSFTKGWIYGFYNNVGQTGFYDTHCVQMNINYDENYGSDAMFYFSLYDIAGNQYSLYDAYDPGGDILYGYHLGDASEYLKSEISGDSYYMTYDGYDTIKLYWRNVSWNNATSDHCITLKKVTEYYQDEAREYTVRDKEYDYNYEDSDSNGPFADRPLNVTKSAGSSSSDYDLETADITVHEVSY